MTYYVDNINKGNASIIVKGTEPQVTGTKTAKFAIRNKGFNLFNLFTP
ncbi:MAG: hypothetical protein K5931_04080 [Lachnospiraceae bacterium]|nr:hypothetical protein [Lachnospiraceae bacterium]